MKLPQSKSSHHAAIDQQAADCLGWGSIAIGLTEIFAQKQLRKTMGTNSAQSAGILRVLGVREIMHGIDILTHKDPTPGVWARVFGDLLDGVLLTTAATRTKNPEGLVTIFAAVAPVVIADMIFAPRLSKDKAAHQLAN